MSKQCTVNITVAHYVYLQKNLNSRYTFVLFAGENRELTIFLENSCFQGKERAVKLM